MEYNSKLFGEIANVVHVANKISVSREIQGPARTFARGRGAAAGWHVRESAGQEAITGPTGSVWRCAAVNSVYGFTTSTGLVDEAWAIPDGVISNGLEPTMLARRSAQLGLISTAHPEATSLFIDRRRVAREAGASSLLIEWSAAPGAADDDRAAWRAASPHWDGRREAFIARKLAKARAPQTLAPGEPDPIVIWRSQYLNTWPDRAPEDAGWSGERLFPAGAWEALAEDATSEGAALFAIEDHMGLMVAVAAAARTVDGRISVEAYTVRSRLDAVAWVRSNAAEGSAVLVGPAIAETGDAADLVEVMAVDPATSADTARALSLLRTLVTARELVHPPWCAELAAQVESCRVQRGASGLRVVSTVARWDLVRAAAWCVAAVERERRAEPAVY
jgi:hypothetical protein